MSNLEKRCPVCGNETLQFSQNADILFEVIDGKLVPQLGENSIGWMDATYLYCHHCGANDEDNGEIYDIKFKYDHHM